MYEHPDPDVCGYCGAKLRPGLQQERGSLLSSRNGESSFSKNSEILLKEKMQRDIILTRKKFSLGSFGTAVKLITPVLRRDCQFLLLSEDLSQPIGRSP